MRLPRVSVAFVLAVALGAASIPAGVALAEPPRPAPAPTTEVVERRTATSRTTRNADGTFTTSLHSGPVHYRDERGGWQPIDSTLVDDAGGYRWRNRANSFGVRFKDHLDADFLRVEAGGTSFGVSATGVLRARAEAAGAQVAYRGAMTGVDLRYDVVPEGVKETIVLADASAPTVYRFEIAPAPGPKVHAERRRDGSWWLTRAPHPGPLLVLEAPRAVDSAPDGQSAAQAESNAVLDVREVGDRFAVEVRLDGAWLRDPARRFPVLLDPTITIQPSVEDASFAATCGGCTPFVNDRVYVGTDASNAWRGALTFDLAAIPAGVGVTDARLGLYFDGFCMTGSATFCGGTSHPLAAHRMTSAWTTSSTSSSLGFDATALSTFTLPSGAAKQWMTWPVTATVANWLSGAHPNFGLLVKRATEPLATSGPTPPGRRSAEPTLRPRLEVTYTSDAVDLLEPETLHSDGADLRWTRYVGPSGAPFSKYEVHRSASPTFTPSSSTLLAEIRDVDVTTFRDTTAAPSAAFTYRVVANTAVSNARTVTLPADGQASKVLQPDPTTGQSTYLYLASGMTNCANYGAENRMFVGANASSVWRGVLGFDLRDVPTGSTVTSARLSLWQQYTSTAAATLQAHRLTRDWREGTGNAQDGSVECTGDGATWYDAQGGTAWGAAGGDFDPTPVGTLAKPANEAAGWDELDVTGAVRQWAAGTAPNHGLLVKVADEAMAAGKDLIYHTDEYGAAPSLRPKLAVTYADGSHARGPSVSVAAPGPGASVAGTAVALAAAATDDRRVERVDFLVDGAVVGSDTSTPFTAAWNSTAVANGAHTVAARATDDAGNVTTSAGVGVTVDNSAPPTTSVTAPAGGATVTGTAVAVTANAADDRGVTKVEFLFDDQVFAEDATAPYTATWNTLDPAQPAYDGSRVLKTRAYDASGQVTTSAPVTVTVGNTTGTKYRGTITSSAVPQAVTYDPAAGATQESHGVDVTLTNTSSVTWDSAAVKLHYRWYSPDAVPVVTDGGAVSIGSNLRANRSTTVRVLVAPPTLPVGVDRAAYRLQLDLRDAGTTWFAAKGNQPLDNPVIVNKRLRTALGLERYYHYQGEDLGAGVQHLVNVANGNSLVRWTPFQAPGRGLSTVLDLTYNSLEQRSESPAGNNVSLSLSGLSRFGNPLDVHPNNADSIAGRSNRWIAFTDGDGTTHRFEGKVAGDGSVYWEEPPGVHLYLREYSTTDPARKWALTRPDRVTFFYDTLGFPTSVEDRNGNRLVFTLQDTPPGEDPGGPKRRVVAVTDAAGLDATPAPNRRFTVEYFTKAEVKKAHQRGKIRRITDHTGSALDFEYYEDGNLLRVTQRGGTKADGSFLADRSVVFTYTTSAGDAAAIPDPALRANPDPKTPNQSTRLFSVRDPLGRETTFTYYGPTSGQLRWKLASRTDRAGATTSFGYDIVTRVTTVTAPLSRVGRFAYDADGKVTTITNPKNESTTVAWSPDFHVTKVTEPTGAYTEFAYNANGYLTDAWDQLRNRTAIAYADVAVDTKDVAGKWRVGRSIPHISQPLTKTDPRGTATASPTDDFQWAFVHDPKGNLTKVTDPEGFTTTHVYNANGTLASTTDGNNHATTYAAHDANGHATRITDAKGRVTTLSFDDDGLLRWVQDPRHASDAGADPREYRSYLDYDSFHRLGRQSAPKSTATERGRLVWSAADRDANDNVVLEIGPHYADEYTGAGAKTTTTYDAMDRRLVVTGPDTSADPLGERTAHRWDAAGRLVQVTRPKGVQTTATDLDHTTLFDHDPMDRVVRQTRYEVSPTGVVANTLRTHYCYDAAGDLRSTTAPKAGLTTVDCALTTTPFTTRLTYDAAHRMLTKTDPLGNKTSRTYDANGNVATTTDANNATTTLTYDERNLLVRSVAPFVTGGRTLTTAIEYDGVGNRKRLIPPRAWDASPDKQTFTQYVTTQVYDEVNQLVRVDLPTSTAYPQQQYVHYGYDPNGNLTSTSLAVTTADPAAVPATKKTVNEHFDTGWIRTSKDPANPRAHFDYTAEGWQASRTPEKAGGGLDSGQQMTWTYFVDGMLKERKDRGGQGSTYTYDANNKLLTAKDASGLVSASSVAVDVTAAYDSLDRVTKSRLKKRSEANWKFTTFGYDLNGNVVDREEDGEETETGALVKAGRKRHMDYDAANWLTTHLDYGTTSAATDDQRTTTTFAPTGWERSRVTARANGTGGWDTKQTTTWTHFANGKLRELLTKNGAGATIESHTVSYEDPAGIYVNGHRTKDVFTLQGPDTGAPCRTTACTATFTYDPRDRLVREDNGRGAVTDYTLDPAGNIVTEAKTKAGSTATTSFTYTGEQLATVSAGGVTQKYLYDPDGNVDCVTLAAWSGSSCPSTTTGQAPSAQLVADYTYDYLNRLEAYRSYLTNGTTSSADDTSKYTYDALDRVEEQTETHSGGAARTTAMSYLGLSRRLSEETHKNAAGTVTSTKSYAYDAFGHRIGMTRTQAGGTPELFTYGNDVHGSVSVLLSSTGTATATYAYSAYGATESDLTKGDTNADDPVNPFRYSAKRYDSGSGTLDMGARRFGPDVSRFLQPDLYDGAMANLNLSLDPLTANRYSLAGGNPVSFVEVDGHMVIADGGGGGSTTPTPDKEVDKPFTGFGIDDAIGGALDFAEEYLKQRARQVLDAGKRKAAELSARAMRASRFTLLRLPIIRDIRRGHFLDKADDVLKSATSKAGWMTKVGKVLGPIGTGISAFSAGKEQWDADADEEMTTESRWARTATTATATAVGSAGGAWIGGTVCAPLAATVVGAVVTAGCAAAGGYIGGEFGKAAGTALADMIPTDLEMPDIDMPDIDMPDFDLPDVNLPDVDMPDLF